MKIEPSDPASRPHASTRTAAAGDAFEAMLLRQMLSSMRAASLPQGELAQSDAGPMRDMLDSQLADAMARQIDFGFGTQFARLDPGSGR